MSIWNEINLAWNKVKDSDETASKGERFEDPVRNRNVEEEEEEEEDSGSDIAIQLE